MSYLRDMFAPITPDDINTREWKPHPTDENKIIGTWAEDESGYTITCPYQLRSRLILLQNILPDLFDAAEREK